MITTDFVDIELVNGTVYKGLILAKALAFLVIRTVDDKYLLISRDVLKDAEKYKFRD